MTEPWVRPKSSDSKSSTLFSSIAPRHFCWRQKLWINPVPFFQCLQMILSPIAWKVVTEASFMQWHWGSWEAKCQAFCSHTWPAPGFCSVICTPSQRRKRPWALECRGARELRPQHAGASWLGSHPSRKLEGEPGTVSRPGGQSEPLNHVEMSNWEAAARCCSWGDREVSSVAAFTLGNCTSDFSRSFYWTQSS